MILRRVFFWLHLGAGVAAGLVILLMSVTGVLLAYERQIVAWADRDLLVSPPTVGAAPSRGLETAIRRVREARPEDALGTVTVRRDPGAPLEVGLGREGLLYVDASTGAVRGVGSRRVRAFFRSVTDWHRWLGTSGDARTVGRHLTGASNLAFLFLVSSGVYLWWPREWTRRAFGQIVIFRRGQEGRARDFNWHNVAGFWSALPLFFMVSSAVLLSYPWANDLLYRLTGSEPPPRRTSSPEARGGRARPEPVLEGLDALLLKAEGTVAGWRTISFRLPTSADETLTFSIDEGAGARPDLRAQVVLDRRTGAIVRFEPYESQSLGRRLRSWARWLHTGEAGGLPGQTVAAMASAGGALLVWTGLAMAWRRFAAWKRKKTRARTGPGSVRQREAA